MVRGYTPIQTSVCNLLPTSSSTSRFMGIPPISRFGVCPVPTTEHFTHLSLMDLESRASYNLTEFVSTDYWYAVLTTWAF